MLTFGGHVAPISLRSGVPVPRIAGKPISVPPRVRPTAHTPRTCAPPHRPVLLVPGPRRLHRQCPARGTAESAGAGFPPSPACGGSASFGRHRQRAGTDVAFPDAAVRHVETQATSATAPRAWACSTTAPGSSGSNGNRWPHASLKRRARRATTVVFDPHLWPSGPQKSRNISPVTRVSVVSSCRPTGAAT